jgi:hypothetical protein
MAEVAREIQECSEVAGPPMIINNTSLTSCVDESGFPVPEP